MCLRVQTVYVWAQGKQTGVVRNSLKGGAGPGTNGVLNNKAYDLRLQATSSPRNRKHNISGTDLVTKPVLSTAYISFIGKQTKPPELHGADSVHQGIVFPLVLDTARGRGNSSGRVTGSPAQRMVRVGFLPSCATHLRRSS